MLFTYFAAFFLLVRYMGAGPYINDKKITGVIPVILIIFYFAAFFFLMRRRTTTTAAITTTAATMMIMMRVRLLPSSFLSSVAGTVVDVGVFVVLLVGFDAGAVAGLSVDSGAVVSSDVGGV